jgi:Mg2+ and Co2+ transporter CorA
MGYIMSDSVLEKLILDKLDKLDNKLEQVGKENQKIGLSLEAHERRDHEIFASIDESQKQIIKQLSHQSQSLDVYNEQLRDHMRRTDLLEKMHKDLQVSVNPLISAYNSNKAINNWFKTRWKLGILILSGVSLVIGVIFSILNIIKL